MSIAFQVKDKTIFYGYLLSLFFLMLNTVSHIYSWNNANEDMRDLPWLIAFIFLPTFVLSGFAFLVLIGKYGKAYNRDLLKIIPKKHLIIYNLLSLYFIALIFFGTGLANDLLSEDLIESIPFDFLKQAIHSLKTKVFNFITIFSGAFIVQSYGNCVAFGLELKKRKTSSENPNT